jgi:hypothetical protein
MRAQHQTTMTVHVRKLNRGMNNQQSIKQAKQQKPVKTTKLCFGMGRKGSAGVQGVAHGVLPAMRALPLC